MMKIMRISYLFRKGRLLSFLLCTTLWAACTPQEKYVTISGYAQGGTYTVKFNADGLKVPVGTVRDSVDSILRNIDRSMSGYNKNSLLSRFNCGEPIVPDSLFIDVYEKSYDIYEATSGVVDVASAPLYDIWGFGFTGDSMPSDEKVSQILGVSGMGRLRKDIAGAISGDGMLDPVDMLLPDAGAALPKLNYNAVAQGYSCDVVARYLYSVGVHDMLVDIGEIFCDGKNPQGQPWTLGIDRPVDGNNDPGVQIQGIFRVPEGPHGVVTSGNYRKFYIRDGKKYSHTVDPRTGYPVEHSLLSATVIAPDGMLADAYATFCMVIGLEASKEFLASSAGVEGCLIYDDGTAYCTWCSDGFVLEEMQQ